jgi:hypothetical protein
LVADETAKGRLHLFNRMRGEEKSIGGQEKDQDRQDGKRTNMAHEDRQTVVPHDALKNERNLSKVTDSVKAGATHFS